MDEQECLHMFEQEENHWWYAGMRAIVLSLLPPAGLRPSARILDLGCGKGYTMGWLRERYAAAVTGIDYYHFGLSVLMVATKPESGSARRVSIPNQGTLPYLQAPGR